MKKMIVDSHCDTALKLYSGKNINNQSNQITLENALNYEKYIQFFAMYMEPEYAIRGEYNLCIKLIEAVEKEVEANCEYMKILKTKEDLENYLGEEGTKLGAILTVEDGVAIEGKIENLVDLYERGIRVIGLTWNGKNKIAAGVDFEGASEDGLSNFGKEVVSKMNELGIIIDVSHLSERSFYDVVDVTKEPIIASHSCAKALCNHKRNLTDEQIRIISDMGGVIGVNFYTEFVNKSRDLADISFFAEHIRHIYNVGGKYSVGLGSDFDGIKTPVRGLEDNSKLDKLFYVLKDNGFSEDDIDNIMWRNHIEFLRKNLP